MNWKQLYTSSTEAERLEVVLNMLAVIEARQNKIIFTGTTIVRNRRRVKKFHTLNDQRGRHIIARAASIITFVFPVITMQFFIAPTIEQFCEAGGVLSATATPTIFDGL